MLTCVDRQWCTVAAVIHLRNTVYISLICVGQYYFIRFLCFCIFNEMKPISFIQKSCLIYVLILVAVVFHNCCSWAVFNCHLIDPVLMIKWC